MFGGVSKKGFVMANVVFDVNLDSELFENIDSLRSLRLEALNKQLKDIESTLDFLELQWCNFKSIELNISPLFRRFRKKIHTVRVENRKKRYSLFR